MINFNTSHVNVNPFFVFCFTSLVKISIHLMLMLISVNHTIKRHKAYFNTSHVNVNRYSVTRSG